jgi:polyketide biosynthesis acyl carrier protein
MNENQVMDVVRRRTVEVLADLAPEDISFDGTLADLGANSLDRLDILTLSMEDLGITVPPAAFSQARDLRSLVALLVKHG